MIRLSTYCKIFRLWITFYSYWLINYFVFVYAKKDKSDFFIILAAFFYATIIGLIICGNMTWFDYHPSFASEISSLSLNDLVLDDLNFQKQEELEAQKEAERLKRQTYIWIITTLVVYSIVFSI